MFSLKTFLSTTILQHRQPCQELFAKQSHYFARNQGKKVNFLHFSKTLSPGKVPLDKRNAAFTTLLEFIFCETPEFFPLKVPQYLQKHRFLTGKKFPKCSNRDPKMNISQVVRKFVTKTRPQFLKQILTRNIFSEEALLDMHTESLTNMQKKLA